MIYHVSHERMVYPELGIPANDLIVQRAMPKVIRALEVMQQELSDGRPFRHVGIGSDLDGFVKPTLAGIETAEDMCKLEAALADRYGPASANQICSENALRMLYDYRWPD